MGTIGTALKFGMELYAHMERTLTQFHGFNQTLIGGGAAEGQSCLCQQLAVVIVELIAMAVTFLNMFFAVSKVCFTVG